MHPDSSIISEHGDLHIWGAGGAVDRPSNACCSRESLKSVQVVQLQLIFIFFDNIDTSNQPFCLKIGTRFVLSKRTPARAYSSPLERANARV